MLKQVIIAGLGGALGSILRFGISSLIRPGMFPFATLSINIAGSFLIGLVMGLSGKHGGTGSDWSIFFATGICGGFTTFSAFSNENLLLLQNGKVLTALIYISLSVFVGIIVAWLGYKLTTT